MVTCCMGGVVKWPSTITSEAASPAAKSPWDTCRRCMMLVGAISGCRGSAPSAIASPTVR